MSTENEKQTLDDLAREAHRAYNAFMCSTLKPAHRESCVILMHCGTWIDAEAETEENYVAKVIRMASASRRMLVHW